MVYIDLSGMGRGKKERKKRQRGREEEAFFSTRFLLTIELRGGKCERWGRFGMGGESIYIGFPEMR